MSGSMIIVGKKYRIHIRYSDKNFNIDPKFDKDKEIHFKILIFTDKKICVLVDVNKLEQNYEEYRGEKVVFLSLKKAKECEADEEKQAELKSLCDVVSQHEDQDLLKEDERIEKIGKNEYKFIEDDDISSPSSDQDDESSRTIWGKLGSEGKLRLEKEHYVRERNPKIRKEKIKDVRKKQKKLSCEICHVVEGCAGYPLDFRAEKIAEKMFEVHHIKPFAEIEEEVDPKLEDLAVLCANCHRMVHVNVEAEKNFEELKKHFKQKNH